MIYLSRLIYVDRKCVMLQVLVGDILKPSTTEAMRALAHVTGGSSSPGALFEASPQTPPGSSLLSGSNSLTPARSRGCSHHSPPSPALPRRPWPRSSGRAPPPASPHPLSRPRSSRIWCGRSPVWGSSCPLRSRPRPSAACSWPCPSFRPLSSRAWSGPWPPPAITRRSPS